jgi:hypothetical protein
VWRRSVPDFPPICSGFIFCEFFSNLGRTGCRRGRTPERPLRQPSKVWLIKPDRFSFLGNVIAAPPDAHDLRRAAQGNNLISQSVALCGRFPLRWKAARFRFVIKRPGAERQGGRTQEASDVSAEIARPFAELR